VITMLLFVIGTVLEGCGAHLLSFDDNHSKRIWGEQVLVYGLGWSACGLLALATGMFDATPVSAGLLGAAILACFPAMWWTDIINKWPHLSLSINSKTTN